MSPVILGSGALRDYRRAWREFASGVRDVVFPFGTYGMRLLYGVQCAGTG